MYLILKKYRESVNESGGEENEFM